MRFLGGVSVQWWAILSATPLNLSKGESPWLLLHWKRWKVGDGRHQKFGIDFVLGIGGKFIDRIPT
jgi:hypothetical protein